MNDPLPENIGGQKTHSVNWEINVAHLSWGLAGLLLAYVLWTALNDAEDGEDDGEGQAYV